MAKAIKSEKYHGSPVTFKRVRDVDDKPAVQYFIDGRWMGTVSTKAEAMTRAKKKIGKGLNWRK